MSQEKIRFYGWRFENKELIKELYPLPEFIHEFADLQKHYYLYVADFASELDISYMSMEKINSHFARGMTFARKNNLLSPQVYSIEN